MLDSVDVGVAINSWPLLWANCRSNSGLLHPKTPEGWLEASGEWQRLEPSLTRGGAKAGAFAYAGRGAKAGAFAYDCKIDKHTKLYGEVEISCETRYFV
jgi:hypothetical protein